MSNNFETVRDTRNMPMNHDYETRVALSDSVNKTYVKCPLANKSQWRHIRFEIKCRYLGNHASQKKSYYGTLSESHGRSFRIRHKKSPEAPPGGEITMTSYPACSKISLSRKPCIAIKCYYESLSGIIIALWEFVTNNRLKRLWRRNHDDVISGMK